jgi:hypothetical protein
VVLVPLVVIGLCAIPGLLRTVLTGAPTRGQIIFQVLLAGACAVVAAAVTGVVVLIGRVSGDR